MNLETQAVIGIFLTLYIIGIAIPSFTLNGLIVLTFIKTKALHTPANLIAVHLCIVGLIVTVFYSPVTVSSFLRVMLTCRCDILYYHWLIGHVFHFSLYPLNILLLTISYFVILKFSSAALSFTKAILSLITIWIISTVGHIPILFLTTQDTFTECCESVCLNETAICNNTVFDTFTPHTFSNEGRIYYNIRVELFIIVPSILVFVTSAAAYYVYKKKIIKTDTDLRIRMLLLPILMSFSVGVFILGQDVVNWQPSQINNHSLPGILVFVIMGLIWDSNGVYFAILILYFNVNIRKFCFKMICKRFRSKKNQDQTTGLSQHSIGKNISQNSESIGHSESILDSESNTPFRVTT